MPEDMRTAAKVRYVQGNESIAQVAQGLGISGKTAQKWCKADGWVKARKSFQRRAARKAVDRAVDKRAKELSRLIQASQSMEAALLSAARALEDMLKENPLLVVDGKFRSGNMRNVAESLERQAKTSMMLGGILPREEEERLALMRRKQELEEKKLQAEAEKSQGGQIEITLGPELEELAK